MGMPGALFKAEISTCDLFGVIFGDSSQRRLIRPHPRACSTSRSSSASCLDELLLLLVVVVEGCGVHVTVRPPRDPDVDDPALIRGVDQFVGALPLPLLFILRRKEDTLEVEIICVRIKQVIFLSYALKFFQKCDTAKVV